MTELKPCPFCGGEAKLTTETRRTDKRTIAYVSCKDCLVTTEIYGDTKHDGTFIFGAIDAWNKRVGEVDDRT